MLLLGLSHTTADSQALHKAGVVLREEMLRRFLGIQSPLWRTGPHGKPYLPQYPEIDLSVSHTGTLVLCALRFPETFLPEAYEDITVLPETLSLPSDGTVFYSLPDGSHGPVGADAEKLRVLSPKTVHRLAKRYFPHETIPAEDASTWLLARWTALESRCKCSGRGLFAPPETLPAGRLHAARICHGGETYLLHVFAGDA